jgi:sigma-B regulation protein RsbU (phosphoserine phosphatase)
MFVTLFLCIIDLSTGELKFTNAGHNPPYLKRVNGEIETLDTLHGPVVGAVEDFVYKEDRLKMLANDKLILFTDGVNEAMNIKNELYSNDRIIKNIKKWNENTLEENLKGLYNSVIKFQGEAEQADDITILGFEYLEPILNEIIFSKTLTIKNQLTEIDRVNEIFNEVCEQNGVLNTVYRKFNIAFDEIINNIVSYGYNDKKEHEIKITINITEDHLVVSIEDDAIAFNPLNLASPDTDASIEDREIGGLGVHMVKKLMDNVSYKRYIKKNLTTLYKKFK